MYSPFICIGNTYWCNIMGDNRGSPNDPSNLDYGD